MPVPQHERAAALGPGDRLGSFELIRRLGAGGMGEVFLARQEGLNRLAAVKTLSPRLMGSGEALSRFMAEFRATGAIEHPNVVTAFEAGEAHGIHYLAMTYVDGPTVGKMLSAENAPLDESQCLRIVRTVAEAMDHIWRRHHLLHRDIKPGNIMIDSDGSVKLMDMGLAKRPQSDARITRRGATIGTPHYMSPEQARGRDDLDFRADLYSLGATLYHMVTGSHPFDGNTAADIASKHIQDPLPPPRSRNPRVSPACEQLLYRMMAKDRDDRHASWADLIADLDRVSAGAPPITVESAAADSSPALLAVETMSAKVRRPLKLALTLVCCAVLLAILNFAIKHGAPEDYQTQPPTDSARELAPEQATVPVSEGPPASLEQRLAAWLTGGRNPIHFARALERAGDPQQARQAYELICREHPGIKGRWALAASKRLVDSAWASQDTAQLLRALAMQTELVKWGYSQIAATAYVELSAAHQRLGEAAAAEDVLWTCLRENPDGDWVCADRCASALLDRAAAAGDQAATERCARYAVDHLPPTSRTYLRARGLLPEPPAGTEVEAGSPEQAAELAALQSEIDAATVRVDKDRLLLSFANRCLALARTADALAACQDVADHAATGDAAGQALLQLAAIHKQQNSVVLEIEAYHQLLDRKLYGPDRQYGLAAALALVQYYGEQGNAPIRNQYLTRIVEAFPGPHGSAAAAAAFELAAYYESKELYRQLLGMLREVRSRFPGVDGEHERRAVEWFERLRAAQPQIIPGIVAQTPALDLSAPFVNYLEFNGVDAYLAVREAGTGLSAAEALTVECWLRRDGEQRATETLLSRYGNNQRGFNLSLSQGIPVWVVYDGTDGHELTGPSALPAGRWTHLAATASPDALRIYVDGHRVAATAGCAVSNDGAGHLKIGRRSWEDGGYFLGAMQRIRVFDRAVYADDFAVSTVLRQKSPALITVTAFADGPRELSGNRLEIYPLTARR